MAETREIYKTLDLALRVGEMLLSSGAGAADVSATMLSVAHGCGLRGVSADVTFTSLRLSYQASMDEPALIQMRQVTHRDIDYEDLTMVDQLVTELLSGNIDRDEARTQLARIVSSGHRLPRWAVTLGFGLIGAGVGMLLGGDAIVIAIAGLAAVGVDLLQRAMSRRRLPTFYQQVAGGMLATLVATGAAAARIPVDPSLVVTACIIMLLAGINFMGAIQDALTGFPLTAGARILEAMLATAGVIAGVSGGITFSKMMGVDLGRLDPGYASWGALPWMTLGAGVCAAAFAFASYAPIRAVVPIGLIGAMAELLFYVSQDRDFGRAWGSAIAAVAIGLVSYSVATWVRVPPLVVVVSAIVPLLPGLSIYRGLSLLAAGGNGILSLVTAAAIAISLASGVILGEYIAQPLRREARKLETRLSGPRLVGPLRARSVKKQAAA
ncbi:MAG: threonine/serine ThrE exporter family protein [Nocardioides sp.]